MENLTIGFIKIKTKRKKKEEEKRREENICIIKMNGHTLGCLLLLLLPAPAGTSQMHNLVNSCC